MFTNITRTLRITTLMLLVLTAVLACDNPIGSNPGAGQEDSEDAHGSDEPEELPLEDDDRDANFAVINRIGDIIVETADGEHTRRFDGPPSNQTHYWDIPVDRDDFVTFNVWILEDDEPRTVPDREADITYERLLSASGNQQDGHTLVLDDNSGKGIGEITFSLGPIDEGTVVRVWQHDMPVAVLSANWSRTVSLPFNSTPYEFSYEYLDTTGSGPAERIDMLTELEDEDGNMRPITVELTAAQPEREERIPVTQAVLQSTGELQVRNPKSYSVNVLLNGSPITEYIDRGTGSGLDLLSAHDTRTYDLPVGTYQLELVDAVYGTALESAEVEVIEDELTVFD